MKKAKKVITLATVSALTLGTFSTAFAGSYVVQKGDYLSKIAPKFNTTWRELANINKLENPNVIFPNQVLKVPDLSSSVVENINNTQSSALTSLSVTTMDNKTITPAFSPDVKDYSITVQSDIYGILINPVAKNNANITVTAAITPGAYGEEDKAEPIVIEKSENGYIIPLTQTYEGYDSQFTQNVAIDVNDSNSKTTYNLKITRENDSDVYSLFKQETFKAADGTNIEYNIYIPSNYDSSKKYPVVLALHGSGQMEQSADMILKRYQMATVFAKDSEKGINQCIVVAPHATFDWSVSPESLDIDNPTGELSAEGQAAYELIQELKTKYSIDASREYIVGLSMGGHGTMAMIYNYPYEFAGVAFTCASFTNDGVINYDNYVPMSGRIYIGHAEDDTVIPYADGQDIMKNFDSKNISYESKIYPSGTFFYPSAHFSWVKFFGDKDVRDWLFSKTRQTEQSENSNLSLSSFDVTTMDNKTITPAFSPDVKDYSITVQSDIYGILINPVAENNANITVTAAITPGAYGKEDKAEPIVIEKSENGYVIPLTQTYEGYNDEFVQNVTIDVSDSNNKESYHLTITRENDSDIYSLFKQEAFKAADGTNIDYNIYVPSNYDSSKKYPVVLALHGSGQMTQPVDMILKRYQMATVFAKDSEKGINQCIVVAPQAKEQWNVTETIDGSTYPTGVPSAENEAAYELLQEIKNSYSVDNNRIYITGLSMGGMGSLTMVYNHPDEFAAMVADAARDFSKPENIDYSVFKSLSGKIYYFHAQDDPTCSFESGKSFLDNLTKAGIEYKSSIYPSGTFFYPSAHFSWVPCYANTEMRNWLFEQTK